MPLGLLKMCVGVSEIDQLARWQHERLLRLRETGNPAKLRHVTRNRPRRADEILDGGSLYWVIKGCVRVRQRITALERVENEKGLTKCGLVLDPILVQTELQPRRPHQGWRYLEEDDAPPDLPGGYTAYDMPEAMIAKLRELGLL